MKAKNLCKIAVVAALYVALCITISPISYGALQFRVANLLEAFPLFNKKYAPAVLLGVAIANFFSPLGVIDVLFGTLGTGVAYLTCVYGPLKNCNMFIRTLCVAICVAVCVGIELYIVYSAPLLITMAGIAVTTFIANVLGAIIVTKTPLKNRL